MNNPPIRDDEAPEIEIFRAGDYPQGTFSVDDIDEIVAGFDPKLHEPPVKLDHDTGPAYGWVAGLRRQGDTLLAKLRDLAPGLIELVRAGRYKKRSAEIYTNFQKTGKKVLRAIAFQGAKVPEVKGLANPAFAEGESTVFEFTTDPQKEARMPEEKVRTFSEAEMIAIVDARVKEAAAEAVARFAEAQAAAEKERKRAEEAETKLHQMEADRQKDDIHLFCEQQKKDGKFLPAWQEKGIEAFMASLDGNETLKFSESSIGSQVAWFREFLGGLPKLISLDEIMKGTGKPAGPQLTDMQRKINRQLGLTDEDIVKFGEQKKEN